MNRRVRTRNGWRWFVCSDLFGTSGMTEKFIELGELSMSRRLRDRETSVENVSHGWQVMVRNAGNVVSNGERQPEYRWTNSRDGEIEIVSANEFG